MELSEIWMGKKEVLGTWSGKLYNDDHHQSLILADPFLHYTLITKVWKNQCLITIYPRIMFRIYALTSFANLICVMGLKKLLSHRFTL